MKTGCVMMDLLGTELTLEERQTLSHPHVGSVILFARNYQNRDQLQALIQDIRSVRDPLIIAVDQEGGRPVTFASGRRYGSCIPLPPLPPLSCPFACHQAMKSRRSAQSERMALRFMQVPTSRSSALSRSGCYWPALHTTSRSNCPRPPRFREPSTIRRLRFLPSC